MGLINLKDIPYVPARNMGGYKTATNIWIVIHDMEAPERLTTAEDVARYFSTTKIKASVQYNVDVNSIVRSVPDERICYGAAGLNLRGLHIEHAGYARQTRDEWLDEYGLSMFENSAQLSATLCDTYNIPPEHVGSAGILSNTPGIVTHWDSTKAFNIYGGHTDPGANFPMDFYLERVRYHLGQQPVAGGRKKMLDVAINNDGRAEEFRIGNGEKTGSGGFLLKGKIYHRWQHQPNGSWSTYTELPGYPGEADTVTAFRNQDGRLEVIAMHSAFGVTWRTWQDQNGPNGWIDGWRAA